MGSAKLKIAPTKITKGLYHFRSFTDISTDLSLARLVSQLRLKNCKVSFGLSDLTLKVTEGGVLHVCINFRGK